MTYVSLQGSDGGLQIMCFSWMPAQVSMPQTVFAFSRVQLYVNSIASAVVAPIVMLLMLSAKPDISMCAMPGFTVQLR
jgi:hypothetical protein